MMNDGICRRGITWGAAGLTDIHNGISRAQEWPGGVSIAMDPDYRNGTGLADSLNVEFVVVSGAVKRAVEATGAAAIGLLPVQIIDHMNRAASRDYFILHPPTMGDCIDREASRVRLNSVTRSSLIACRQFVLRENAIPPSLTLSRPRFRTSHTLVRQDLAEQLTAAGLTGLGLTEPLLYGSAR